MNAAMSRALSATARRRGGATGSHASVSRSRCGSAPARARRAASVDLPEPEFPRTTVRSIGAGRDYLTSNLPLRPPNPSGASLGEFGSLVQLPSMTNLYWYVPGGSLTVMLQMPSPSSSLSRYFSFAGFQSLKLPARNSLFGLPSGL